MSSLIKMNTEEVLNTMGKLRRLGDSMEAMVAELNKITKSIPWRGSARDNYVSDFTRIASQASDLFKESEVLTLRGQREVEEWIEVDQRYMQEYNPIGSLIIGIGAIGKKIGDYIKPVQEFRNQVEFRLWWKGLSEKEKKDFLRKILKRIAEKMGIPLVELKFPEIQDPFLKNAHGNYDPNTNDISVDLSDLSDDPCDLIDTLAHESRHKYQFDCVKLYKETGTIPDGMTQAEIEVWKTNVDHYVGGAQDFEIYHNQVIEGDARDSGEAYANEFINDKGWLDS